MLYVQRKERVDFAGKEEHFQGKRNEQWHPYDRRSGTGRGRELAKGGHGKGNWGDSNDIIQHGDDVPEGSPPNKVELEEIEEPVQETEEKKEAAEVPKKVEEEPEEEKGKTFQEYQASRKKVNIKKEVRQHEELKKANVEQADTKGGDRIETKVSSLKQQELYTASTAKSEAADLLGFQGGADDEFVPRDSRGGRGGRGRGGRGGRGGFRAEGA